MSGGNLPFTHHIHDLLRQVEQAQGVCDGRTGLAHPFCHLLLGHAVALHQLLIAGRLLDGVEVLALQVFDQRDLHRLLLIHLPDDDRDLLQARHAAGAPTALACHQLIAAARQGAHQQRLQHAVLPDGIRQLVERLLREDFSRLVAVWLDLAQAQGDHSPAVHRFIVHKQGVQPLAEPSFFRSCHPDSPYPFLTRFFFKNSFARSI